MTSAVKPAFNYTEAYEINGIHTEIVFHTFANKHLLIITQYEKLNNLFVACNDVAFSGNMHSGSLDVKHQFGAATDEIECGVRFLLKRINPPGFNQSFNVVVCLGLKEYNGPVLRALEGILNKLGKGD